MDELIDLIKCRILSLGASSKLMACESFNSYAQLLSIQVRSVQDACLVSFKHILVNVRDAIGRATLSHEFLNWSYDMLL